MPWRGPEVPGEFPTLGYLAIEFAESLPIPDGPKRGEPFRLTDEQAAFFLRKYRLNPNAPGDAPSAAALRYRGVVLVRPQKWGKDPIAAVDDLFQALGPSQFAGWDASGEPVGKPHPSAWVAVCATNDLQTDNTWIPIQEMVKGSWLSGIPGVDVTQDEIRLPSGNKLEPLTMTAWGRLGGRFTAATLTESALLTGEGRRGGLAFGRTIKRNVGGMGGQWFELTNPWDPTENSIAQQQVEAVDRGKTDDVLVDFRRSRRRVDIDDDAAVLDELEHLYGDSSVKRGGWVVCERILGDVRDPSMGEAEVRRFYLQEIVAGARPFCEPAVWAGQARGDDPLQPGEQVALGFDGSRSSDSTALWAYRLRDQRLFRLGLWVPAAFDEGLVPRLEVDAAVRAAFSQYAVAQMFADPYRWQDYLDKWAGQFGKRVVEFPTTVERRMDSAIRRFLGSLHAGELTHDGDPDLSEHVANTALAKGSKKAPREDAEKGARDENHLRVVKKRDGLIDALVAAILAVEAGGKAMEQGALVPDVITIEGSLCA